MARINKGERPDFIVLDALMAETNGCEPLEEPMRLDRSRNVILTSCSNELSTNVQKWTDFPEPLCVT